MSAGARLARDHELPAVAALLDRFNKEYDEPTPGAAFLAQRLVELDDVEVMVIGEPICGLAVMRFRRSLWTPGLECYLAELYVVPERRGGGMGRALMDAVLERARARGADHIELNTDETDTAACALYESLGFAGTAYYYERELRQESEP
jgi:ribosomal protein S18 acetylase RimI-like enzyme